MKIYRKLFFSNLNKTQLIIANTSTLIGFLLLMIGINYIFQIQLFRSKNELLTENVFVVQRKVSNSALFKLQKTGFTTKDQEFISKQKFIDHFQPLTINDFDLDFQLADEDLPYMRTDIFIQSIDPEFLDVKHINWHWNPEQSFVPIIIPKEFLVMLNSFMSSKGMPQISDEAAKQINFKFNLKKGERKETFPCRVVGFTNTFSAVLVPPEFMKYGSIYFGNGQKQITQLIISHKPKEFGAFKKFLKDNYLETKTTDLMMSQVKSISLVLFNFIVVLAGIIIFLSTTLFIQYSQLLIESKKYEVQTMIRLGHRSQSIAKSLFGYFVKQILIIDLITCILFVGSIILLNPYFAKYGLDFVNFISFYPFVIITFINFALFTLIRRKMNDMIKKIN